MMRPQRFRAAHLTSLLRRQRIATMAELKAALGTTVDVTVFRKLKELSYRTSYSHRGAYYTLDEVARFDERGLWSCRSVGFSRYGTLVATVEALVASSEAGTFAGELANVLNVGVKEALLKLVREGRIARQKVGRCYLYCSAQGARRREQLLSRRVQQAQPTLGRSVVETEVVPDELKAAIVLFFGLLDEKQRRLYAGLESVKFGHGGDRRVAELTGLDPGTVARGRRELLEGDVERERVRKAGGGRKAAKKNAGGHRRHRGADEA